MNGKEKSCFDFTVIADAAKDTYHVLVCTVDFAMHDGGTCSYEILPVGAPTGT